MKIILSLIGLLIAFYVNAQDYITRNGYISFYSHTPVEDIKADNNEVVSTLNTSNGAIEYKVAIKSFHFAKQSMEDHFNNSDYMDSEQFPKGSFSGKITDLQNVNFTTDGTYNVTVEGNLTIKAATKPIATKGTITVKNGKVVAQSTFTVNRKDYNVIGEAFMQKRISDQIQVMINCEYEKR